MNTLITQQNLITKLESFQEWVKTNCKGRERGEAQIYLDRFFQCFGHQGVMEAGGTFEYAQKSGSRKGNTGFFDCLYPGIALFEMKQRGTNLTEHYNQLLTYWTYCVPKPKVGILCNFDEFWIYDFNVQVDTPVQILTLPQLSKHPEALLFMLGQEPRFQQNLMDITEDAAAEISKLYRSILARREKYHATEEDVQRFVLQCVLCLFAEDIGLLPDNQFTDLLEDCRKNPKDSYNLLHGLFTQMNTKKPAPGGRFKDVKYFNGGLFQTITPIELEQQELEALHRLGYNFRWENVRPSIFGTIFEKAIGHVQGSHFTSEVDIYKIVNPTIVRYWDERIEAAGDTIGGDNGLKACLKDLRKYKVLDPACGSGNFLYVAFQEMKRIEKFLMERIKEVVATSPKKFKASDTEGTDISLVSPLQLYGIEIKPFAVELARLTLEIGRKVAVNKFSLTEDVLPLDNLNENIICADALYTDWPKIDAIIGNPPFIGGNRRLREELGTEYVEKLYNDFPEIKGQVDYCVYWFRAAQDSSAERIGLVATNTIRQEQSRIASLDYILDKGGIIHNAISSQDWEGEANLDVSIVNWIKTKSKVFYLDDILVENINSSLEKGIDFKKAYQLRQNLNLSYVGIEPAGEGFLVSKTIADFWISQNPTNIDVLKNFSMGKNLTESYDLLSNRWIIDFNDMPIEKVSNYELPFQHVKQHVKPLRDVNRRPSRRIYWWHFGEKRPKLRKALEKLKFCFAVPDISKWCVFVVFPHSKMLPGNRNNIIASEDFYLLGVLTSQLNRNWVEAHKGTLEDRTDYTTKCFETFPFLWDADEKLKQPVRDVMTELENYRMQEMKTRQWGITKLYNAFFNEPASQLFKLHKKLDETVCKVYGWKYDPEKNYNEDLFYLNQKLYQQEQAPLLKPTKPAKQTKPTAKSTAKGKKKNG
jgi:SAM-dependent methyltransferase